MGRFVAIRVQARDREALERALAEAHAAGASGAEEREDPAHEGLLLVFYAPSEHGAAVRKALVSALGDAGRVSGAERVPERDWSEAWRAGLGPVALSPRLALRPPFAAFDAAPGQAVLVIEPGQAFGTGHHASTRLALVLLEAALADLGPARAGARVLDVGTGSGVLSLAALALGAERAVGCDLDPVAVAEANRNARANDLSGRLDLYVGSPSALRPTPFDVVVANLIRRELAPLLREIAARTRSGGRAVLSGLLAAERDEMHSSLAASRLAVLAERTQEDGGDLWLALLCQPV